MPSLLHASDGMLRSSFPDFSIIFRCSQSVRRAVGHFEAITAADWWQMLKLHLFTEDRDLYRITDFAQFLFFQLFIALKQSPVKANPARWIVWLISQLFVKFQLYLLVESPPALRILVNFCACLISCILSFAVRMVPRIWSYPKQSARSPRSPRSPARFSW